MTNPISARINALDLAEDTPVLNTAQNIARINAGDVGPGRIQQGRTIDDSIKGIDHSFLNVETPYGISIDEQRAKNQTTTDKWLSGGIKGLSTFVTATGQTVGAVGGGIAATAMMALGNDFDSDLMFKNPVLEFFAKWNETVKERNPNYYSQAEMNASVIEGMATANFWSDKFLDGVGFMASAIMTGYGAAKFGAQLGINIASKIGSGFNTMQAALVGRTGESAIEANDAYEQTLDRLKATRLLGEHNLTDDEIEDKAKDARAATFGFNMAIALTDAYQFGKIFKTIDKQAVKRSIFGGSRVAHATEQMLIESQEENYQLAVADMAINMANDVTSKETDTNARDYFNNIVGGMMDNFSTKEGQESMLLGGLLGGGMGLAMHSNERSDHMKSNVPDEVKKRNTRLMSVFNKDIDANYLERVAATQNDGITEGLAKNLQLINLTLSKIKEGKYEEFIEELNEMAKQTPEQFQEINITLSKEDIVQQHSEAKNLIEGYKALYDAMEPKVFDLKQENAYEAIKANLFYVTAVRNDIRTQLTKVGPFVSAVTLALKAEPDLAMDEPLQVGKDQVIPQKVIKAQEKLVENREALTKYINRVKTGKKLQKEIVDAYNKKEETPPVPTPTPKETSSIGNIQKTGKDAVPGRNIPFTKAVKLEDGSTNFTVIDDEGLETIINDVKDGYTQAGMTTKFVGDRQKLNQNERYNFLQIFKRYATEEKLDRLQEILSRPDWRDNIRFTANKQNTGNVLQRIKKFIAQGNKTEAENVWPTALSGVYMVPSSLIQVEMQIKDSEGEWDRLGHPGADPFKWKDKDGESLNFSDMNLEQFKEKFVFHKGTIETGVTIEPTQESLEQLQRDQQESIKVYNAINAWYESEGFTDQKPIPEGFIKAFTSKLGFDFTKVGEWSKGVDHTMLKDAKGDYVIIDMNTGKSIIDGKKYDVPASVRKQLGNTRYVTKVNHPTVDDIYIKAAPGQLDGQDARDFITKLNEIRETPTQDGADELNAIMYVAYQGNWNFKFDVHTIKGTKKPKLVIDVFNDQLGKSYKNIALPIHMSSLSTLQSLIEDGTDGKIELGRFAFKKHISKERFTNEEVEKAFTFNTKPKIVDGVILQFKFNNEAPAQAAPAPKPAPKAAPQTDEDIAIEEAAAAVSKKGNDTPKFKQSAEKASEVIHYNEALAWLEKVLPKGIKIEDMATVTANLETQGYTWGMFANKVVYLSTQAQQGTEAHEAFHAIFAVMLSESERSNLYSIAKAKWGEGHAPLFYEEKMADEFMDWKNARNRRVSGTLQAFFNRIVQFAQFITGRESELKRLFRKIDTGAFTNKELLNHQQHVYDAPVYKLLNGGTHYKMSVIRSEEVIKTTAAYVLKQLNNDMEYEQIEKAVTKLTSDYMFAQGTHYNPKLEENRAIIEASNDKYALNKMAELSAVYQNQENIDLVTAEVLKLVRSYEIRSIDDIMAAQDETEESFKQFDIHQGEYGGWANVAKEIKQFIGLTTYEGLDNFNKHITKSIDFVLVYGALQRRLAGKSRPQQLLSFESFARTDEQVNALWNRFLVETGYDPITGIKTNEMLFNRFLLTFELENIDYMQSLRVKDKKGNIKLINMSANRANPEVIHFENWERKSSEYNIFSNQDQKDVLSQELIFEAANGFTVDTSDVTKQNSIEFFKPYIKQIRDTFGKMGIDLSEGYVLESLEEAHSIGVKAEGIDADREYRMLEEEDILEIANLLKKGDNIFEQKLDEDGNILEKTGARGRLISMASGDIHYRTDIYDTNFQDAENKSRYSFVQPSYILTKIRDSHNITEVDLQALKDDPYYKYNPLVQSSKAIDHFLNLKAAFTGDYRDTVEDTDGKTFKSTTPKELLLSWYGLYNANKDYSYVTPMIYEAKSTSISVNMPNKLNEGKSWVSKSGDVNDDTIRFFIDTLFMQEHQRINGKTGITFIEREENPWVTLPYFNGEGMKFKDKYITEYSKQDIIDNKEGVRKFIGKAIAKNLTSEIETHQAELVKYGIIKSNGENVLLDSDIENVNTYTAEYFINDLVNSLAIAQIVQGDLAKAKNPFDRVKRNGGELAYGPHFGEGTFRTVYKTSDLAVDEDGDEVDRDDAQVYVSMNRRIDQLDRQGRLTDELRATLRRVEAGENITEKELNKLDLLPLKTVYYGMQEVRGKKGYMVYHKMSETVLAKALTSKLVNGVWVAQEGMEKLHNMLMFMEDPANAVDTIVTLSASKLENPSEAIDDADFVKGIPVMGERFTDLDNRFLRLQVEMKSGKEKIISGTQMAQLIDLLYDTDPKLRDRYYKLLAQTRSEDFNIARFMANPEYAVNLANKLIDSIETSGGDSQLVDLLKVENGKFKYNFNLPHIAEKLEQLMLAHFSKGVLQQKVPGYKLTLMSASGIMIKDKDTGEIRDLRMHKISKDGKTIELAEVMMTRRALRKILGPKANVASIEKINKELLEMVGTRIPTQAHHSMIPFKVIKFLPEFYGDTIIAPSGIVKLSGADYDIDSLFVYRKDFFMDADKNVHVYGNATTQEGRYAEYLNHHNTNKSISRTLRNKIASSIEKGIEEELRREVFVEYGLLPTFEDWIEKGEPSNNSNRNNELVDIYLTILTDPSVEDMFNPATLDLLHDGVAKVHDTLRNKGNEGDLVNHYGANGKLQAHTATSTGKQNVGPVAFINSISAFMTKFKVQLSVPINFLGKEYSNYGVTEENDIEAYEEDGKWKVRAATRKNKSKINSLSTFVSGMTDDAKWGFSAKLNLEKFNLGTFATMISLGIGFNRTVIFSSQDVLADLSSEVKSSGRPHGEVIREAIDEYTIQDASVRGETLEHLRAAGATEEEIQAADASQIEDLTEEKLVRNLEPGKRDIHTDLQILLAYADMQETATRFQEVGTITGLNKGLETSNLIELHEKQDTVDEIKKRENGSNPFYTNLWDGLIKNSNTRMNMTLLGNITVEMSKWFMNGVGPANTYSKIMTILKPSLNEYLKTKEKVTVDRAIKSFLTMRGYQKVIESYGSDIRVRDFNALINPGIKNSLIEKTLARQIQDLSTQEDPILAAEFNNNEFIKILRLQFKFKVDGSINTQNEAELDLVMSNMRLKRNPQTVDRITNGFIELSLDHPELAKNLLRYAIAKDSLQFTSTSFLKFIDITYLEVASQGLDLIMDDPTASKGMELEFVKLFAGYSVNETLFPESPMDRLKEVGSFDAKTETYIAKSKKDRKGKGLPSFIFKTPQGHRFVRVSGDSLVWEPVKSFGDRHQLPYHLLYHETLAMGINSIAPGVKVNTDQIPPTVPGFTKQPKTKAEFLALKKGPKVITGTPFVTSKIQQKVYHVDKRPNLTEETMIDDFTMMNISGVFFTTELKYAENYVAENGGQIYEAYVDVQSPFKADKNDIQHLGRVPADLDTDKYDSVIHKSEDEKADKYGKVGTEIVVYNPEQIKLIPAPVKPTKTEDPKQTAFTKHPATKAEFLAQKKGIKKSKNILSKEDGLDTLISYNFSKAIERLSKVFGVKVKYVHLPDVNWSGRYQHGTVELNMAKLQSDTPFHEFAHPFVEAIRIKNKALYDSLVAEIMKEGTILAKVIKLYPELDDAGRIDEAITTAIGMYGAEIANMPKTLVEKVKEFLREMIRYISSLFTPGTIFLPEELNPNTTLKDLGAIMAKNTQVFALGELTDEQAKYQKQQASKLTIDQDHIGAIMNGTKTSSLREPDPDIEYKIGDSLAVYANSRSQGVIVKVISVKNLKSLKDVDTNELAISLGYKNWKEFTEDNRYAKKDSPAAIQWPALYDFLKGEGEMQLITYERGDVVPTETNHYLENKIKNIKTAIKKQIDRYNAILTKSGSREEKIKAFVTKRERLLKMMDAIDDVEGVSRFIHEAKKDLSEAKGAVKQLVNKIGNIRNLNDKQRQEAIAELHYRQEFIVAYDMLDNMTEDEVKDHLGDSGLANDFKDAIADYKSIKKIIDKTAIPLLASWLLDFHEVDPKLANEYFAKRIKRIQDGKGTTEKKAAAVLKLEQQKSEMVLTQSSLEEQLRHATRDIGFGQLWLGAAGSSSDQVLSLFSKAVKFQEFKANLQDRINHQKVGIALAGFEKEQGKAGNNTEKYYGDLIREVTIEAGREFDGTLILEKRTVFKDVEDVSTPAGKELLTILLEVYGEAQDLLPESQTMKVEITSSKKKVDSLPFIRRSGVDRMKSNGILNTIVAEFQEIYKPLSTDTDYGYTTEAGEVIRSVPIHFTKRGVDQRAMENKDISKDLVHSILKFSQMANKYGMFKSIQSEVEFMDQVAKTRTVPEITPMGTSKLDKVANIFGLEMPIKADTNRVNQRLQEFINMIYYGQQEKPNIETIWGHEVDTNKLLNFLGKWTGFTTLALNFLSAINNVILGNFYMFQESIARQNFGDLNLDLAAGKAIYYRGTARMLGDIGKIAGISKETQLVRTYDAIQGSFRDVSGDFVTGSQAKKLWQGSTLFFANHIGEHEMQVSTLFAAMAGRKLTTTAGEEISLFDSYYLDESGMLVQREDVEWSDRDVFAFQNALHATNKSLHGNYNDFDKTVVQKYTLGRLALMFRKFMSPGVRRRLGKLSIDNELSELHEGFFVTTLRLARNEMTELKNWLTFKENNLTEYEKANVKKAIAEIGAWFALMAMFSLAAGFLGDDDDSWAGAMMLYQIRRLQTELGFYFNPAEALKIIKSPAATTTTIQRIIKLTDQLVHVYDPEYTHYKSSGHGHEKGDSKLWDATKDLIPAIQGIERSKHPEEAIKYFNKLF